MASDGLYRDTGLKINLASPNYKYYHKSFTLLKNKYHCFVTIFNFSSTQLSRVNRITLSATMHSILSSLFYSNLFTVQIGLLCICEADYPC